MDSTSIFGSSRNSGVSSRKSGKKANTNRRKKVRGRTFGICDYCNMFHGVAADEVMQISRKFEEPLSGYTCHVHDKLMQIKGIKEQSGSSNVPKTEDGRKFEEPFSGEGNRFHVLLDDELMQISDIEEENGSNKTEDGRKIEEPLSGEGDDEQQNGRSSRMKDGGAWWMEFVGPRYPIRIPRRQETLDGYPPWEHTPACVYEGAGIPPEEYTETGMIEFRYM